MRALVDTDQLEEAIPKVSADYQPGPPETVENEVITIHFVSDGFTALKEVWYRGQELRVEVGSPEWIDTCEPKTLVKGAPTSGKSWLRLTEEEQENRYGAIHFRHGPWRGKSFEQASAGSQALDGTTDPDEREKAEKKFALPGLAVPGSRLLQKMGEEHEVGAVLVHEGYSNVEVGKRVGRDRRTVWSWRKSPIFQARLAQLKESEEEERRGSEKKARG
jgi:hypothetical protein